MKKDCDCIEFHNVLKTDAKMRPGTADPGMHWTYMFMDQYKDVPGIHIVWTDDEGPTLRISKEFSNDEMAFEHLMRFIKMHNVSYHIHEVQCAECHGNPHCLYAQDMREKHEAKKSS